MTVISAEISTLQEYTARVSFHHQDELLGILTVARESVREAAEEAQSGEPALALDGLRKGKAKLQEYGQSLQPETENHRDLVHTAKRLENRIDHLLARYDAWVRKLSGDLLLRKGNSYYIRTLSDRKTLGPPVIEDNHLQIYLRIRESSTKDREIDDLVATCGIWICPNDVCLCTEWECEGDGPSGSIP